MFQLRHWGGVACAAIALAVSQIPAGAHVTLEPAQGIIGSGYKAVLRVPHGCGDSATVRLRVRIPEGVISVKPMAKPGWQIETVKGAYASPHAFMHGATFSEGVKEVTWSGGRLPNELYDEFVLSTFIAGDLAPGHMLYFPVVQDCEKGTHNWVELPSADTKGGAENEPAPGIMLLPKK